MTTNKEIKNYLCGVLTGLKYHEPAPNDCTSSANEYYGAYKILTQMIKQLSE